MPGSTFIYCPLSGSRVLSSNPHRLVIVMWANQSMHVVGDHVVLRYCTAAPRQWYRSDARQVACAITEGLGGVVWDVNGTIHLAVPRGCARRANELMVSLAMSLGITNEDPNQLQNEITLLLDQGHIVTSNGQIQPVKNPPMIDFMPVEYRYSVTTTEATEVYPRRSVVTINHTYRVASPWDVVGVFGAHPAGATAETTTEGSGYRSDA